MSAMATTDRSWRNAAVLLTLCTIAVLVMFVALRPLRVDTPASGSAQALLRLDTALGATVEPIDHATNRILGSSRGAQDLVVTSVASNGPAATAGLRVGDVIERIGGRPASEQLRDAAILASAEPLEIRRDGKAAVINVQLGSKLSG